MIKLCPASVHTRPAHAPGRPKDMEKGAAILDAARRMFIQYGFDGVSMDQIAAEAGVSKLTVYSHYGDKGTLFAAAAKSYCEQQLPTALFEPAPDTPLRERLLDIARAFFAMCSAPPAIAGHRILCTPQMADSPVPRLFLENGPDRVNRDFGALLARRAETGELAVDDPLRASSQFFTLVKGEPHMRLMFGADPASLDIDAHLQATVDMFLRAYAAR